MKLIDGDVLRKWLETRCRIQHGDDEVSEGYRKAMREVIAEVDISNDNRNVGHAHWKKMGDFGSVIPLECSNCKHGRIPNIYLGKPIRPRDNFCSECGCKFDQKDQVTWAQGVYNIETD